jgi:flavin reductase (DIM6/NTAB) family NADH-FMN oxidoreductase RutF/DNA-binding IclR family transcriptional regulator
MTATESALDPTDERSYRRVLGQYPTGVCVITATSDNDELVGLVVGSFTSASLDPPLIAFLPAKTSTTWPKIASVGKFCVNILAAEQESVCRAFASKAPDRFEQVGYRSMPSGGVVLRDVVAWIDCTLESVLEAGDHFMVLARVCAMGIESAAHPLAFFQGGYGRFSPASLVAGNAGGVMTAQLHAIDVIRPEVEAVATSLSARCIVTTRIDDELVVAASATASDSDAAATLVGSRFPFSPPMGAVFVAWSSDEEIARWLAPLGSDLRRSEYRERLNAVRDRGYTVGLLGPVQRKFASALDRISAEPAAGVLPGDLFDLVRNLEADPVDLSPEVKRDIRHVTAPVFGRDGEVILSITLYGFAHPAAHGGIDVHIERLCAAAARATQRLGGGT